MTNYSHLKNRQIIYFHTARWYTFFRDTLLLLQTEYNCTVTIVSTQDIRARYKKNLAAGANWVSQISFTKPRPWEKSSEEMQRLTQLMRECEDAAQMSTSRILLVAERDVGRALTLNSHNFSTNSKRKYSQKNSLNPHLVLLRYFQFADELFQQLKPDLILGRGHASPLTLAFWFMAKRVGIPSIACRESNFMSNRSYWTDDYLMYNTATDRLFLEKVKNNTPVTQHAIQYLTDFRKEPMAIEDVRQFWASATKSSLSFKTHIKSIIQLTREKLRYFRKRYSCKEPPYISSAIMLFYKRLFMNIIGRKYHTALTEEELQNTKYIYIALHKEPEIVLNFRTPFWHNQLNTVKLLSSMLPAGYQLIVREHRGNWGCRPWTYLKKLSSLPGVRLVHSFDSQYKYITNADLIITDLGTTGFEGLIFKRPVITIEHIHYNITDLPHRTTDLPALDKHILKTLQAPPRYADEEYEKRLGWFIDAEMDTTVDVNEMLGNIELSLPAINQLLEQNGLP